MFRQFLLRGGLISNVAFSRQAARKTRPHCIISALGSLLYCVKWQRYYMTTSSALPVARSLSGNPLQPRLRNLYSTRSTGISDEGGAMVRSEKNIVDVSPVNSGKDLLIKWDNGEESKLLSQWLRFNCQCSECVSPSTNQRMVYADKLVLWPKISSSTIKGNIVHIEWKDTKEVHSGSFDVDWLRDNCYQTTMEMSNRMSRYRPTSPETIPTLLYREIAGSDEGLWRWLQVLNEYGVCVVKDAPTTLGEVVKIAEMISYIQETIFGRVWDVIALESKQEDVSYGTSRLAVHQDEIYYDGTPGITFLHCIRNDNCVVGGENIMLDGFPVVEEFRVKHKNHFDTLTRVRGTFQRIWKKEGKIVELVKRQKHHIAVDRFGQLIGINWSQHNGGPIYETEEDAQAYFEAYLELWKAFEESPLKLYNRPESGDVLTLNNKRFLHSRTEFTLNGGVRHLQGTYVTIDGFKSKFRVLSKQLGKKAPMKQMFDNCTL